MQVRKSPLPVIAVALGVMAILGAMLFMPAQSYAWSSCQLNPAVTMLVGDVAAEPDGTLYAVIADPSGKISVWRFESGSCNANKIGTSTAKQAIEKDADTSGGTEEMPVPEGFKSAEAAAESIDPKVAVSPSGDVVITYREYKSPAKAPYKVFMQRKPANKNKFGTPVVVATNGYVGGISIDNANNAHVVWYQTGGSAGGFYRKYNANNNLVVPTKNLTSFGDSEPEVAADSSGNAHVVYMTGTQSQNDVRYKKINPSGVPGGEKDIATNTGHAIYPDIMVDTQEELNIVWQGRAGSGGPYEPYYRHCDNNGGSCGGAKKFGTSTNSGAVDVTKCGSGPYVTWYNADSGGNSIYVSEDLQNPSRLTDGTYNALEMAAGYVHLLYRNSSGKAAYYRQADSTCESGPVEPTNTPTITMTPTVTQTATEGPSPTPSLTPTVTLTPVAPGEKVQVDDKSTKIQYSGSWSVQNNSPSCLYKGSFHYADAVGQNRAKLEFVGTRAKLWFVQFSTMGTAKVLIDGQSKGNITMSGGSTPLCKAWLSEVLPLGTHTIEIRGNSGGRISLDVITIYP